MNHTLTQNEFWELIRVKLFKIKEFSSEYKYLEDYYNDILYWDRSLSGINHILSRILEKCERDGELKTGLIIDEVYKMAENSNFLIQEGDFLFLEELFRNDLGQSISLEEELIIAHNRLV